MAKQNPSTKLLGSSLEDEATILRWSSFANSELLPPIMAWINPVIGKASSSSEILAAAEKGCEPMLDVVARELRGGKKFLVGENLTMADLFVVAALARGYQFVSFSYRYALVIGTDREQVFAKQWTQTHPEIHEYYWRIKSDPTWVKVDGQPYVLENAGDEAPA